MLIFSRSKSRAWRPSTSFALIKSTGKGSGSFTTSYAHLFRSWTIMGIAARAATGLGLNMRNESPKTPDSLKEIRYRVWWSLYVLEHQLGNMTGRQTSISDETCTSPLPAPVDEDQFQS